MQAKVAGIRRKIVAFHQDEFFDWLADLECGHQQHVRHNPPWTTRHWVTAPQGRLDHIGLELPCSLCETLFQSRRFIRLDKTNSRLYPDAVLVRFTARWDGENSEPTRK
jgi:hypothetical protein